MHWMKLQNTRSERRWILDFCSMEMKSDLTRGELSRLQAQLRMENQGNEKGRAEENLKTNMNGEWRS